MGCNLSARLVLQRDAERIISRTYRSKESEVKSRQESWAENVCASDKDIQGIKCRRRLSNTRGTHEPEDESDVEALTNQCDEQVNESTTFTRDNAEKTRVDGELRLGDRVECDMCKQMYANESSLKKHMYNVHKMVRVKCHVCDKEVNKKSLDRHMKSVHSAKIPLKRGKKRVAEEDKIPCALCKKKCPNQMSLRNHVKNVHEAEQLTCDQCDFRGIKRHLEKHVRKEHSGEVYQCGRCQKILKSKSTLKEHMWIHTDHRRFICDVCGMRFKRTSNYHGHLKSHQDKKFQCQLCGNFFLRKRYLAVHEQTIHNYYGEGVPPQEKGYQCEVCGVKLKWKNNLLAHMRIHTGEKPYRCKICGDNFTCHGSLRTHLAKHEVCDRIPTDISSVFMRQVCSGPSAPASSSLGPVARLESV